MTRLARGGWNLKIKGKFVNIYLAKIVYKCEICQGDLAQKGKGLCCRENSEHRGFIHRDEVKALKQKQEESLSVLSGFYAIEGGKVIVRNANHRTYRSGSATAYHRTVAQR